MFIRSRSLLLSTILAAGLGATLTPGLAQNVIKTNPSQVGSGLNPQGGQIDRNQNGEPTGILRETAQSAVLSVIPKPTHRLRWEALELALADLAEHGVTFAQDYSPAWENF